MHGASLQSVHCAANPAETTLARNDETVFACCDTKVRRVWRGITAQGRDDSRPRDPLSEVSAGMTGILALAVVHRELVEALGSRAALPGVATSPTSKPESLGRYGPHDPHSGYDHAAKGGSLSG